MNRLALLLLFPLLLPPTGQRQQDPLLLVVREIRAVREAEAVFAGHVVRVHTTPGIWCGFVMTWQDVTWHVDQQIDGTKLEGDVRVGHLLVANSPLVASNAPFLRPDLFWKGARAVLCVTRRKDGWIVTDEAFGARMVDGAHEPPPQHAAVLQAVLSAEALRPHLHLDRADHAAVRIELDDAVPLALAVTCGGQPVEFLPPELAKDESHLRIDTLEVDGDTARVHLSIPAEGVTGDASLTRHDGAWSIDRSEFSEH